MSVRTERTGAVATVVLCRPERKNAIDRATADALTAALLAADADPDVNAIVLWGEGGTFCAGADLHAIAEGQPNRLEPEGDGPLGPTRLLLQKPVIAAISGHAVAGGLELAAWCDLRVAEADATLGVYCRRFGVPLIDGGTVRLPRIIGFGRALDLILTGRGVGAEEALAIGLVNRVVPRGEARAAAEALAAQLSALPQACLRSDRQSAYEALDLDHDAAMRREFALGLATLEASGAEGPARFARGEGRHGR